jgi:transposase
MMIGNWKQQAIAGMASTFGRKVDADKASEAELDKLHTKIGQLVVEQDFLSKAFGR